MMIWFPHCDKGPSTSTC